MVHKQRKVQPSVFKNELRGIKSLDLLLKAGNVFEKLFWLVVFILGMAWATYFLSSELESWQEIPSIITYKQLKLSELQSPAITFCSPSSTKFAIAERLGNYLNADYSLPDKFLRIRKLMVKEFLRSITGEPLPEEDVPPACPSNNCKVIM